MTLVTTVCHTFTELEVFITQWAPFAAPAAGCGDAWQGLVHGYAYHIVTAPSGRSCTVRVWLKG